MQISANESSYCKFDFECVLDDEQIQSKSLDVLLRYKDAKVPGFREGKASLDHIKATFRKQIDKELAEELSKEAVQLAIAEKNIKIFGAPAYKLIDLKTNEFKCNFTLYSLPTFELGTYKGFSIPKPAQQITVDEFSQKMLQELRIKNGNHIPYGEDDFIQFNDNIIVNMKAFDGETPVEKFTLNATMLNVGTINIPEFSENIIGMKVSDKREFDATFPENYPNFGNKTLKFEVELLMGAKTEPAALDDELAKKLGLNTFEELSTNVMSMATTRIKEFEKTQIFEQISKRLVQEHNFVVPEWIAEPEAQMAARSAGMEYAKMPEQEKLNMLKRAEESVKLSLILNEIRTQEPDAQCTDEEAFSIIKSNISQFSQDPEKSLQDIINNGHLQMLFARVRDEMVLEFIEKQSELVA
jgi:trigger factor